MKGIIEMDLFQVMAESEAYGRLNEIQQEQHSAPRRHY